MWLKQNKTNGDILEAINRTNVFFFFKVAINVEDS